jgi:hypothetical protein
MLLSYHSIIGKLLMCTIVNEERDCCCILAKTTHSGGNISGNIYQLGKKKVTWQVLRRRETLRASTVVPSQVAIRT